MRFFYISIVSALVFQYTARAENVCSNMKANAPIIDKDVCPGEGCQLGDWIAGEQIGVLNSPTAGQEVFFLKPGEKFAAVYGENHVVPVEIAITEVPELPDSPSLHLKRGDHFFLFTNEGEGMMSACYGQEKFSVDCTAISNMPETCKASKKTWARAVDGHGPKETWWVKVKNAAGKSGWIKGYGHKIKGQDKFSS